MGDLTEEYQKTGEVKWKIKTFMNTILVNMAASVMRQDDLKPLHGNLDWEKLFRVADYNKISNLIYLAILGNNEKMPDSLERWKTRFYERYSDILKFNESCTEGEREILVLLELKNPGTHPFPPAAADSCIQERKWQGKLSEAFFFLTRRLSFCKRLSGQYRLRNGYALSGSG